MPELAAEKTDGTASHAAMNRIPASTYRLQLSADFTLDSVLSLLPYLTQLGVTDLYLSPLFRARAESSHGYDVVDHGTIDPAIGDMQSFVRLAEAARAAGMGILLDIVPNHMGINDPGNVWWNDVLENGENSCFADYFDIEWYPPAAALQHKILLPFLGNPFGDVLESGELRVIYRERRLQLEYGLRRFPLAPGTWPAVLKIALHDTSLRADDNPSASADREELASIITQLHNLPPAERHDEAARDERYREQRVARQRLEHLLASSPNARTALDSALRQINGEVGNPRSFDALELLLDQQWYRLAYWRVAADEINYRRFFDVNDLAAIRVEDPRVFDAVHRLVARLLEAGLVTGLRIDHPDGLRDPQAYFKNLQSLYRPLQPDFRDSTGEVYLLAEKILCGDEPLRSDWNVCGTTGYDLLNIISRVQVDADGLDELRGHYDRITGEARKPADVVYESRRTVLLSTMASELQMLSTQLGRIARQQRASRDFTQPALQQALREVLACMTVYRTYARGDSWDISDDDYRTISAAVRLAKRRNRAIPHAVFDFIASMLLLEHPPTLSDVQAEERRQFALKFQQVSGPVAAKGVEDTAFYRYYPLASLNEVGGELDAKPLSVDEFHRLMRHRAHDWPHAMSATSTHDSKRGEDLRARLHVLSEAPDEWASAFTRWQKMNAAMRGEIDGEAVPDASEEYLIYQTLLGIWPVAPRSDGQRDQLRDRMLQYVEKAFREAKIHTSWMNPSEQFEIKVRDYLCGLFAPQNQGFLDDLSKFAARIADAGFVNSLAQLLLKLTLPGVPDFYRGAELWDFNLVDPDNRRPVDYNDRRRRLGKLRSHAERDLPGLVREIANRWPDPDVKLWVTSVGLNLRRHWPDLFAFGEFIPLVTTGAAANHIIAFARRREQQTIICVVPRHFYRLTANQGRCNTKTAPAGPPRAEWGDTKIVLPDEFAREWISPLTGEAFDDLTVQNLFATFPVALLASR